MIRLSPGGLNVTKFKQGPVNLEFNWDDRFAKDFEQFFVRMELKGRKVAFDAVRRGWTIFPIGSQLIWPSDIGAFDIALLGEPYHGELAAEKIHWDEFKEVDFRCGGHIMDESLRYWRLGETRFFKLNPDYFEAFVCATRLCLENPAKASTREARYKITRAWFKTTATWKTFDLENCPF